MRKPKGKSGGWTKAMSCRIHARHRAKERYGLDYQKPTLERIRGMIHRDEVIESVKQSNTRTIKTLCVDGVEVRLVWDRSRQEVVTFLPPVEVEEVTG